MYTINANGMILSSGNFVASVNNDGGKQIAKLLRPNKEAGRAERWGIGFDAQKLVNEHGGAEKIVQALRIINKVEA